MKKLFFSGCSTTICNRICKISKTNDLSYMPPFLYIRSKYLNQAATQDEVRKQIKFKCNAKPFLKQYPKAESLLNEIQNIEVSEQLIIDIVNAKPEIALFDPSTVVSNISELLHVGFEPNRIMQMVIKYPHLLEYEKQDIIDTFESWRSAGVHEKFLWDFFSAHPTLFSVSNDQVTVRIKRIKYFMMDKINRITSLLMKNPTIMYGDWNRVEEKFKYLYHTIRVPEKDISRSSALSLPLSHIKLRYTFVERCGEYTRPKKKDDSGFTPNKNPPLHAVVDTTDDTFALNVAKVSPDEFAVFKKLMNYEEKKESEEGYEPEEGEEFGEM